MFISADQDDDALVTAKIFATPTQLRSLARFLLQEADLMDQWKDGYEHSHYCISCKEEWKEGKCDVIVLNPNGLRDEDREKYCHDWAPADPNRPVRYLTAEDVREDDEDDGSA